MRFIYTSIGLLLAISGETIALKVGDVVLKQWVENVREYAKWNAWARTREELDSLVEAPPERLVKFLASVEVRKQVPILCRHLSQGSESSLQVAESLLGIPFGIMNDSLRTQFCTMVLLIRSWSLRSTGKVYRNASLRLTKLSKRSVPRRSSSSQHGVLRYSSKLYSFGECPRSARSNGKRRLVPPLEVEPHRVNLACIWESIGS